MRAKIKTNKKKYLFAVSVLIIAAAAFISVNQNKELISANAGIPTSYLHGSFRIDVYDQSALVGDADYVFAGRVEEQTDTEYKFSVVGETSDGPVELSSPYTNYSVTVLKNIKGELIQDSAIPVQKAGGLEKDKSTSFVYEDDVLPEAGEIYVFFAYAQPDGSLLVSGPNSNIPLEITTNKKININIDSALNKTEEYKDVLSALENQKTTDRQRFVSDYDASNQK